MSIQLRYAARSDVGLVRSTNQDSGYASPHLLVLADGMGGPAGGDIASSVAVAHLAELDDAHGPDDLLDLLRGGVERAHQELMSRSAADSNLEGLGTTCIAILRSANKLAMVHIGDSRAYRLRDKQLTQVTEDHTFVQFLVSTGKLSREEAEQHPRRNVILRALGDAEGEVELDESVREAVPGDRWLLASDGLFGFVSEETIAETLATEDPGACADELIELSLRAGAPDNVTVVVADIIDDEAPGTPALDSTPQIVGAAATDRLRASRGSTSAAGRAAALASSSEPTEEDEEPDPAPSAAARWVRRFVAMLLVIGVLALGAWGGWTWTQTQYFVAEDEGSGNYVAIFQGIPQEIGPVSLASQHEVSDIEIASLTPAAQTRLQTPITRASLSEAEAVVENLRRYVVEDEDDTQQDDGDAEDESSGDDAESDGEPDEEPTS